MPTKPLKLLKKQLPRAPRPRGFAAIAPKRRSEIARLGGRAVAKDRKHMSVIGALGGAARGRKEAQ